MQHKTIEKILAEFGEENVADALHALELAGYFRVEWDATGATVHPTQKFKDELIPEVIRA